MVKLAVPQGAPVFCRHPHPWVRLPGREGEVYGVSALPTPAAWKAALPATDFCDTLYPLIEGTLPGRWSCRLARARARSSA